MPELLRVLLIGVYSVALFTGIVVFVLLAGKLIADLILDDN